MLCYQEGGFSLTVSESSWVSCCSSKTFHFSLSSQWFRQLLCPNLRPCLNLILIKIDCQGWLPDAHWSFSRRPSWWTPHVKVRREQEKESKIKLGFNIYPGSVDAVQWWQELWCLLSPIWFLSLHQMFGSFMSAGEWTQNCSSSSLLMVLFGNHKCFAEFAAS